MNPPINKASPVEYNYHHHIDVRGVVIPTWVAIILSIMAFSASIIVLLSVLVFKSAAEDLKQSQSSQTGEMRVIILHIQDIENVLIRARLAERKDFAEWDSGNDNDNGDPDRRLKPKGE